MGGFLDLLKQYGPALLDTAGSLYANSQNSSAANNAADRTQFMPYNLNLAGNTANFSGNQANAQFSGPNGQAYQGLQGLLGGAVQNAQQGPLPGYLQQAYDQSQGQSPDFTGFQGLMDNYNQATSPALNVQGNQYLGAGNQFLQQSQRQLATVPGWQDAYNQQLGLMRQSAQPQEDQLRSGNYDNQFAKGILASSAGQYQTQGLEGALANADLQRQQAAFGQSQQFQQNQQNLGLNSLGAGINSSQMGAGLLGNNFNMGLAGNQAMFGAQSNATTDRLNRALAMFGAQNQGAQTNQQQVSGYLGNIQGMENGLQNMVNLGGNLGAAQSGANSLGAQLQYKAGTTNANNVAGLLGNTDWNSFLGKILGNPSQAGGTGGLDGALGTGSSSFNDFLGSQQDSASNAVNSSLFGDSGISPDSALQASLSPGGTPSSVLNGLSGYQSMGSGLVDNPGMGDFQGYLNDTLKSANASVDAASPGFLSSIGDYAGGALGAYNLYQGIQQGNPTQGLAGGAALAGSSIGGALGIGGAAAPLGAGALTFAAAGIGNQLLGLNDPYVLAQGATSTPDTEYSGYGQRIGSPDSPFSFLASDKGPAMGLNGTKYTDSTGKTYDASHSFNRTGPNPQLMYQNLQDQGAQLPDYQTFLQNYLAATKLMYQT